MRQILFSIFFTLLCLPSIAATIDPMLDPVVFDARFYLETHADLRAAGLKTPQQAQSHWLTFGAKEGRRAVPGFWSQDYMELNPDLQVVFGPTDFARAVLHYSLWGKGERHRIPIRPNRSYGASLGAGDAIVGNEQVLMRTWAKYSGTVAELWFRGKQFINSHDTGRLLQTAVTYDGLGECLNPTEGGGAYDPLGGPSSSKLLSLAVIPGVLSTETQAAHWLSAGQTSPGCPAGTVMPKLSNLSKTIIRKDIQMGYLGDPTSVRWAVTIKTDKSYKSMLLEALTGYLNNEFKTFFVSNPVNRVLENYEASDMSLPSSGAFQRNNMPMIVSTIDKQYAMGVIALDRDEDPVVMAGQLGQSATTMKSIAFSQVANYAGATALYLGTPDDCTTKWTTRFSQQNVFKGSYTYQVVLFMGTVDEVHSKIQKFYDNNPYQMLTLLRGENKGFIYQADYYKLKNPDLVSVFGVNSIPANFFQHFMVHGISEGRLAHPDFNTRAYLRNNSDISDYFGINNVIAALKHYLIFGRSEGRKGN